jgi:hypothetical protein
MGERLRVDLDAMFRKWAGTVSRVRKKKVGLSPE